MAKQQHLNNAPIIEALIDIQVEPKEGLTIAAFQSTLGDMDFGYYVKGPITRNRVGFKWSGDGRKPETASSAEQLGLRLHSTDEKYVAQCRVHGFTLSRLPPYLDWSALVDEAERMWNMYRSRLSPVRVKRVATRYINNLRLPLEHGASFQTYLRRFADVPEEVPQSMTSFFQSFHLVDVATKSNVNLNIALESTPQTSEIPVILDIDAFLETDLDPGSEAIWDLLGQLRALKNRCFFGSLTDQALELYK